MPNLPNPSCDLDLRRDAFGRLLLVAGAGADPEPVTPVRAFPLSAPHEGVSLIGSDGHERAWIGRLSELPASSRELIEASLCRVRVHATPASPRQRSRRFSTPSTWSVETDRGPTELVLKGEEDIRRLADGRLLITDAQGLQFVVPDPLALDRASRRLLERFL